MKRLIKYSILTVLVVLAYFAVTHTHTDLRMRSVISNRTIIRNSNEDKRLSDIIFYLHSNNQKTTVDNDKQYKYKQFCQVLYRNQCIVFKSQISIKNHHSHFEADYPIDYYIYALNKIIT